MEENIAIDRLARVMAANSGIAWDRLDHYPGFLRGRWRDQARLILKALTERQPR